MHYFLRSRFINRVPEAAKIKVSGRNSMTHKIHGLQTVAVGTFICILALVFMSSPVYAQANTARWGADYTYFTTNNARQCDRACEDDGRCKAWVYVKRSKQCRLKYMVTPIVRNADCCVSGVKGDGAIARGRGDGKRGRCAEYAERAVSQGAENLRGRCGFRGEIWHQNYNRHFNYCMDVRGRVWRATEREREGQLGACERRMQARLNLRCDHLARLAVQQSRTNAENRCGFSGPYWNTSFRQQVRLCQDEGAAQGRKTRYNLARFEKREGRLRRCMLHGGGARDKACDDYADAAVNHYKRNLRYRCKLNSDVWNDNKELHYNWCQKSASGERSRRLAVMNNQIKRCKKRRGWKKIFKF